MKRIRRSLNLPGQSIGGFGAAEIPLDVKQAKLERIRLILKAPARDAAGDSFIDCLSSSQREEFGVVDDGPISSHGYDEVAQELIERFSDGLILDCGAGSRPIYFPNVVNLEICAYPSTDVLGVGEDLPFKDSVFDAIFSLAVLEHVSDPFRCAAEIERVLKPGGILYVVVPFLQHYHGYPHHYYNMTWEGLRNLFKSLDVVSHDVPPSGLPVWTASHFLARWAHGLDKPTREHFLDLRVRDLIVDPIVQLDKPYVVGLPRDYNFELASTTALIARKPSSSAKTD